MSSELLLPIAHSTDHQIDKFNTIILVCYKICLIIADLYFVFIPNAPGCDNGNDGIINLELYLFIFAIVNMLFVIYKILDINKPVVIIIYHMFMICWNIVGIYLLSELMEHYSCNIQLYNYLFVKIIISYFEAIFKIVLCLYEN